jgi:FAD synthetase
LTRVLATGTFDILHPGHLLYLERSKELGDELVVIVARDVNVKHKPKPIVPEDQRLKMVQALEIVDLAILGDEKDIFRPIEYLKPDIITLGFDQHFNPALLEAELARRNIASKVVRVIAHDSCELCSSRKIIAKALESHI